MRTKIDPFLRSRLLDLFVICIDVLERAEHADPTETRRVAWIDPLADFIRDTPVISGPRVVSATDQNSAVIRDTLDSFAIPYDLDHLWSVTVSQLITIQSAASAHRSRMLDETTFLSVIWCCSSVLHATVPEIERRTK